MRYDKIADKWSSLHIISGWLLAIVLYYFFPSMLPICLMAPMIIIVWEIIENIAIKPKLFPNSPFETKTNIISDILWTLLGVLLFIITLQL